MPTDVADRSGDGLLAAARSVPGWDLVTRHDDRRRGGRPVGGHFTIAVLTTEVGPLVLIVLGLALVVGALYRSQRSDVAPLASTN